MEGLWPGALTCGNDDRVLVTKVVVLVALVVLSYARYSGGKCDAAGYALLLFVVVDEAENELVDWENRERLRGLQISECSEPANPMRGTPIQ